MPILGKIEPKQIDLKAMIEQSKVLSAAQKQQFLEVASALDKTALKPILDLLLEEQDQLNLMQQKYLAFLEKAQEKIQEKNAVKNDQAEVEKLLKGLQ